MLRHTEAMSKQRQLARAKENRKMAEQKMAALEEKQKWLEREQRLEDELGVCQLHSTFQDELTDLGACHRSYKRQRDGRGQYQARNE